MHSVQPYRMGEPRKCGHSPRNCWCGGGEPLMLATPIPICDTCGKDLPQDRLTTPWMMGHTCDSCIERSGKRWGDESKRYIDDACCGGCYKPLPEKG